MLKENKQRKRNVEKTKIMETQNKHDCPKMAFGDEKGMTLRDYYAGQALAGIMSKLHYNDVTNAVDMREITETVWDIAGAMMVERNRCS